MKILILFTHNKSFLSKFYVELGSSLLKVGNTVKIYSLKKEEGYIKLDSGLEIQILKKGSKLSNYYKLFKVLKKERPDVVISNFSYVNPAILCGKLLGVKKNIVWFHTLSQQLNPGKNQVLLKSIFLNYASEIIVNSEYLKEDLVKNYSILETQIFTIPFWSSLETDISMSERVKQNGTIKIGCPGRIEEVKNQEIIVEALKGLDFKCPWTLYIAGIGSNEKALKTKIQTCYLENRIFFLGVLSIEIIEQFYRDMNLIILPSKFEAFGLVLIEALSMGCPVLVSKNFGALTYIKDQDFLNRYSFDPNDSVDLRNKIKNIISNEGQSSDYFRNIYTTYFQKEKIIAKVEEVINL